MLEDLGLGEAAAPEDADVLVFNTCTIREKPDTRLAAHLGDAKMLKERDPERVIAVGGCYAEAQRERIFAQYPFVDVAFGPDRSRTWPSGSARGTGVSRARSGSPTSVASPRPCRCTGSGASRRGSRSRWGATRSAPTASSPRCAGARSAGVPARSSRRSPARPRRRPRGHAARPERQLLGTRPPPGASTPSSGSCSARATRSTASSGSAHEPAPEGLPRP